MHLKTGIIINVVDTNRHDKRLLDQILPRQGRLSRKGTEPPHREVCLESNSKLIATKEEKIFHKEECNMSLLSLSEMAIPSQGRGFLRKGTAS